MRKIFHYYIYSYISLVVILNHKHGELVKQLETEDCLVHGFLLSVWTGRYGTQWWAAYGGQQVDTFFGLRRSVNCAQTRPRSWPAFFLVWGVGVRVKREVKPNQVIHQPWLCRCKTQFPCMGCCRCQFERVVVVHCGSWLVKLWQIVKTSCYTACTDQCARWMGVHGAENNVFGIDVTYQITSLLNMVSGTNSYIYSYKGRIALFSPRYFGRNF